MSSMIQQRLQRLALSVVASLAVLTVPTSFAYDYAQPYQTPAPSAVQAVKSPTVTKPAVAKIPAGYRAVTDTMPAAAQASAATDSPILMAAIQDSGGVMDTQVPTDINVIKGRSRIIKFAQPLARVSIADPQLADIIPLAPEEIMINGRQRGVTSLIVWDDFGREGVFDLNVSNDTSEIKRAIEAISPNENINVSVTDDSVVVSGSASNSVILDEIRQVAGAYGYRDANFVDLTETPIPQVVLEVKIVEMSRQVAREIKTSFTGDAGNSLSLTRLGSLIESNDGITAFRNSALNPSQFPVIGNLVRNTPGIIPWRPIALTQTASNVGGITGSLLGFGKQNVGFAFDLLENNGKIKTLAEPKLVSTHGRPASFLAGGEFPYISGVNNQGSPILSFREYGVGLDFTPWINTRSGMIELQIAPQVSSIDRANCTDTGFGQVCGLLSRRTNTTIQLNDGESLMISGILSKTEEQNFAQIPFVGDIPIIGEMFKNRSTSKRDTELIVVVTPRILDRTGNGKPLPSPAMANSANW